MLNFTAFFPASQDTHNTLETESVLSVYVQAETSDYWTHRAENEKKKKLKMPIRAYWSRRWCLQSAGFEPEGVTCLFEKNKKTADPHILNAVEFWNKQNQSIYQSQFT